MSGSPPRRAFLLRWAFEIKVLGAFAVLREGAHRGKPGDVLLGRTADRRSTVSALIA